MGCESSLKRRNRRPCARHYSAQHQHDEPRGRRGAELWGSMSGPNLSKARDPHADNICIRSRRQSLPTPQNTQRHTTCNGCGPGRDLRLRSSSLHSEVLADPEAQPDSRPSTAECPGPLGIARPPRGGRALSVLGAQGAPWAVTRPAPGRGPTRSDPSGHGYARQPLKLQASAHR